MEKDFNTVLRRSIEADRIKLTRRRERLLREMGYSEDLDSAEITEKLHEQVRANDVLNRNLVRRDEEIAKSRKEIAKYESENTFLRARIAELESKLGTKPIAKTSANSRLSDREVLLTVNQRIPREIRAGEYVIENLTWTPEVDISDNYFTRTNTRGTLITTPRKAVIRNNVYEKVGMSAIFISGDAHDWYESGAVKDVTIKDNRFIDCAYSNGTGGVVILIEPSNSVEDPPVHDTIRIISNKFESEGRKPVVSKSVRSLIIDLNEMP